MIATSVFQSFYIADFQGEALKPFDLEDFDIDKMSIASGMFETDLDAAAALQVLIRFVAEDLNFVNTKLDIQYNPEFFPSISKQELSEEQELNLELLQQEADKTSDEKHVAVILTSLFDPIGDYIESRMTISSSKFKIVGRVGIDPERYLNELGKAKAEEMNMFISGKPENLTVALH